MTNERYARHSLIDWFDQDDVKSQHVIVVGAGAVGNEVIKNLVLLGIGAIDIFDRDIIEIHNLTRSVLFRESDVGRPKAECAAVRAGDIDPSVAVKAHVGDFWVTLTLRHVARADVVFCCVDNYEARIRLNRLCAIVGTPMINVGIDSRHAVVERFAFRRSTTADGAAVNDRPACYECALPPSAYAAITARYSCAGLKRIAAAERRIPTTILTSSAAASLAVSVHLRAKVDGHVTSCRYFQDTFSGATTKTDLVAFDGCPGCSDLRDHRVIISVSRSLASELSAQLPMPSTGSLSFSDRLVTHVSCSGCGADEPGERLFRTVDAFDETLATCPHCGRPRQVQFRDQFGVEEIAQAWAGRSLPGKFVVTALEDGFQIVMDLEGNNGRSEGDSADGGSDAKGGSHDATRTVRLGPDSGSGDELVTPS